MDRLIRIETQINVGFRIHTAINYRIRIRVNNLLVRWF